MKKLLTWFLSLFRARAVSPALVFNQPIKDLGVLFGGRTLTVRLVDGTEIPVAVRALPQRFLMRVIDCADVRHALVELCCYFRKETLAGTAAVVVMYPDIPVPQGFVPIPMGWCDNLDDQSMTTLYDVAIELNFQRAVDHVRAEIAAKKLVAPIHEMAVTQVLPYVERVASELTKKFDALLNSTRSAPRSEAAAAKTS